MSEIDLCPFTRPSFAILFGPDGACSRRRPIIVSELQERVKGIAAALSAHGFRVGDRLALLFPNGPEYIELVYACGLLGVIVVPLNTRLSLAEIDRVLADATPHGLVRHSSLPAPTVRIPWQRVLDQEPLDIRNDSSPTLFYDPEAVLALIYTSGTTGHPKGVMVTHANILANVNHLNYWMRYTEGGVYLHAAPIFHIADFPGDVHGACFRRVPGHAFQSSIRRASVRRLNVSTLAIPFWFRR